jgi:hypothetical protein
MIGTPFLFMAQKKFLAGSSSDAFALASIELFACVFCYLGSSWLEVITQEPVLSTQKYEKRGNCLKLAMLGYVNSLLKELIATTAMLPLHKDIYIYIYTYPIYYIYLCRYIMYSHRAGADAEKINPTDSGGVCAQR